MNVQVIYEVNLLLVDCFSLSSSYPGNILSHIYSNLRMKVREQKQKLGGFLRLHG